MKRFRKVMTRLNPITRSSKWFSVAIRAGAKIVRPAKVVVNDLTISKPARHGR
jgi:hypothetical protein